MSQPPTLVWLRQDLRLHDQPALKGAAAHGPVIPVYILDDDPRDPWPMGGASRWWLHYALEDLAKDFSKHGIDLILRKGRTAEVLDALVKETGAKAVAFNRCYEPFAITQEQKLTALLEKSGVSISAHHAATLFEPGSIRNQTGGYYKVYTPFSRACLALNPGKPLSLPASLTGIKNIRSENLSDWHLLPVHPDWAKGFRPVWAIGEDAAQKALKLFVEKPLSNYKTSRDRPDEEGTSRLSPFLHFGHISPRQIWHAVHLAMALDPLKSSHAETFLKEIIWREFAYHTLATNPEMTTTPLNPAFKTFPALKNATSLKAWKKGQTGYPIVDAGMRQLWETGWMHNRVRLIVGSFLVKHVLLPWQDGAAWFWDTLIDADLASNSMNWQWVAGSGIDAAPYFRIFNPILQGKKFDPDGLYVRRFVPELKTVPSEFIHEPWNAPADVLRKAGVDLGKTYPSPIIEHTAARERALDALATMQGKSRNPSKQSSTTRKT